MPIEIKELHIKINVDGEKNSPSKKQEPGGDKQDIIATCVEQVIEILAKQTER